MEIKQVVTDIQKIAEPLISKLEKTDNQSTAEYIRKLIVEIETNGWMSCHSLYLILQGSQFDYIEEQADEAANALKELYELMAYVSIRGLAELEIKLAAMKKNDID